MKNELNKNDQLSEVVPEKYISHLTIIMIHEMLQEQSNKHKLPI
jgi:hypothetical protein